MKRFLVVLVVLSLAFASSALEVALMDADGKPFVAEGRVAFHVERNADDRGVETVRCQLTGLVDATQRLQIVATETVPGATVVWNGNKEIPVKKATFRRAAPSQEVPFRASYWARLFSSMPRLKAVSMGASFSRSTCRISTVKYR